MNFFWHGIIKFVVTLYISDICVLASQCVARPEGVPQSVSQLQPQSEQLEVLAENTEFDTSIRRFFFSALLVYWNSECQLFPLNCIFDMVNLSHEVVFEILIPFVTREIFSKELFVQYDIYLHKYKLFCEEVYFRTKFCFSFGERKSSNLYNIEWTM